MTGQGQNPHPPVSQQAAEAFQRIAPRSRLLQRHRKNIPLLIENAIYSIPDGDRLLDVALGTSVSAMWGELPVAIIVTDRSLVLGGMIRGTIIPRRQMTLIQDREAILAGQVLIIEGQGGRNTLQRIEPVTSRRLAELLRNPPPNTAEALPPIDRRMVGEEAIFLAGSFVGNRSRGGLTVYGALRVEQRVWLTLQAGSKLSIYPGTKAYFPVIAEYILPSASIAIASNTESGVSQMTGPLQRAAAASLGVGSILSAAGFSALTSGLGALAVVGAGARLGARSTSKVTHLLLVDDGTDYGVFAPLSSEVPGEILAAQRRSSAVDSRDDQPSTDKEAATVDAPSALSLAAQEVRELRALYEAGELSEQDFNDWKTEIMRNARKD